MATLKFADTHNMVAFLTKPAESEGFQQIMDFLNANPIRYALTINPTIYTLCIKQLWATVKVKTVNGEVQLQALVDGKKIIITESTVRRDLQLEDAEGVDCLPNVTIFEQLTLIGANTFVDYRTELVEESSKKAEIELEEKLKKVWKKKKKVDVDNDSHRVEASVRVFSQMLKSYSKEDLEDLYKLVKAKYGLIRPVEDLDLILWGDLKTMFEPHVEDQV
ncbi:hypothetical protein Tco_0863903 [Tanacetum coccineum]